jgi:selenide,water dikinase
LSVNFPCLSVSVVCISVVSAGRNNSTEANSTGDPEAWSSTVPVTMISFSCEKTRFTAKEQRSSNRICLIFTFQITFLLNRIYMSTETIRLTQYSHGAGCGCKIAPKMLDEILKTNTAPARYDNLLIGNESKDDAAVYDLGNGKAIISTTDFFMPIVDDAFDFGRIAAANAISDIYAMGGTPLMAVAVLGWPVEKLPAELAKKMIEGGRAICDEARIPLAGGHSIDSPEPIFGLAVTGIISKENLKRNNTAGEGDVLFLTKPLGAGIMTTAQKRGLLKEEHHAPMIDQLSSLNKIGEAMGLISAVTAMTDITGFGLLGHLVEMTDGGRLGAEIYYDKLQLAPGVQEYISQRIFPDATTRNWSSYSDKVRFEKGVNVMEAFTLLPDPQTNGGLLIAVKEEGIEEVKKLLSGSGLEAHTEIIGRMTSPAEKSIAVTSSS